MTKLIRKLFIKDYDDIHNPKVREKHCLVASIVGLISNLILFLFKLLTGIFTHSISIISDAVNNLSDSASGVVNLVGTKLAAKPADKKHPFGHERIEYIAALIIAFIIIALAIALGYTSIMKLVNKTNDTEYSYVTFIILGIAIIIKLWQGLFYKKMSKITNSLALKAASQDSFNDVFSTSAVAISAFIQYMLFLYVPASKPYLYIIDGSVGILIALFIIYVGTRLVIETANPLIGVSVDNEIFNKIMKNIKKTPGVLGTHDVLIHSYGPTKYFMTVHVEVDAKVDVLESHDLIDNIETNIKNKYGVQLTIHMDPLSLDSPIINSIRDSVNTYLKTAKLDKEISYHDLRVVEGKTHTNVLFDIVIPFESKIDEVLLIKSLKKEISSLDEKYNCIIKVDRA